MTQRKGLEKNLKRVKQMDMEQVCLFSEIGACKHTKKNKKTIDSHVIAQEDYLSRISEDDYVMVCDLKSTKYYEKKKNFELSELKDSFKKVKTGNSANTKNLLCGHHDSEIFRKIENKIAFNEKNEDYQEQCFQFALRSFLFQYIHSKQVGDSELSLGHHPALDAVYELNKEKENTYLLKFKKAYINSQWEVLHTEVYTIPKKIHFISCMSFFPYSYMKYRYCGHVKEKLFLNIFPEGDTTKIIISYFKKESKYCEIITNKLSSWYKKNQYEKMESFLTRCILLFDLNVTYRPSYYERLLENESRAKRFFEFSFLIRSARHPVDGMFDYLYHVLVKNQKINIFNDYL